MISPGANRVESVGTIGPGHFIWLIYDVYDQYETLKKNMPLKSQDYYAKSQKS